MVMIDPERIQRLAAKIVDRKDALEMVHQMRCGGKKYPGGGKFFRTNLQNESPLMYQPMVDINYPIETPLRFRPQPDLGDYRAPESTGMVVDYPINLPSRTPVAVQAGVSAPVVVEDEPIVDLFSDEAKARRLLRQRYAESVFDDKAVSNAGARGAWQIMPITYKDYLTRGRGKEGDLDDPDYNRLVRDHTFRMIPRDLEEIWDENYSDRNKLALLYAGYNRGANGLKKYLRGLVKKGVDISKPENWVEGMNPETRNYVHFLAYGEDVPGTYLMNEKFENAARKRGYMTEGGKIHIKPENRGKFTALKKRTGHSASWFKEHGTPAQKKMAVFALNAKKWKHGDGGLLNMYDGESEPTGYLMAYDDNYLYNPNGFISPSVVTAYAPKGNNRIVQERVVGDRLPIPDAGTSDISVQSDTFVPRPTLMVDAPVEIDRSAGTVSIPQRDSSAYFLAQTERLRDELDRFDAKGKTKSEIRSVQQELADSGFYSMQLSGKSKDEIRAIQTKLINRGLLSNEKNSDGSYKEADGIAGKKTNAAWNKYNVDGIWGARSDEAYISRNRANSGNRSNWQNDFSAKGIDGCAKWVTRKYESVLGAASKSNGVVGDAWTMPKNIVNAGGEMLYNLYDTGFDGVTSVKDLKERTAAGIKSRPIDYSILKPGDVVGIFYPPSTHHSDVLKDGTTYNTHVGIVIGFDKDGMPLVEHNINERALKDRADKISGGIGKITTASRPRHSSVEAYPFEIGESEYEVKLPEWSEARSTPEKKKNLQTYMDAMQGASGAIGSIYKNADMDAVQRIAVAVLGRETDYMQNTESSRTGKDALKVRGEKVLRKIAMGDERSDTKSSDLTKFKLSTLTPDERAWLGISDTSQLEDPANAGRAALLTLAKNYDYFVRYANENPQLGLTKQDIEDLTALSYNQGMRRLSSFGTEQIGDNRYVVPSKIQQLRELAESGEVIDDFSASKPGRVAQEFPALYNVMKEIYDNNVMGFGKKGTSYTNAARRALENIRKKEANQ